jgi:serine/threonine protein kinase
MLELKKTKNYNISSMYATGEKTGGGQFGDVYKAVLRENNTERKVAVKMPNKDSQTEKGFTEFLKEAKMMQGFGEHENVVKFIGCVTKDLRKSKHL